MYFFPCLLARFVYSHLCNLRELNKDLEYTYLKFNEHVSLIFSIQFTEIAVCLNFINILFSFTIMFSIPLLLSSNVQIYYHGINCKTKKKKTPEMALNTIYLNFHRLKAVPVSSTCKGY